MNPAALTVTAVDKSKDRGTANPPLTATLSGFVLGQTQATSGVTGAANCTTTATTTSGAGTYPITCTIGTLAAANYSLGPFVGGTLTVVAPSLVFTTPPQTLLTRGVCSDIMTIQRQGLGGAALTSGSVTVNLRVNPGNNGGFRNTNERRPSPR